VYLIILANLLFLHKELRPFRGNGSEIPLEAGREFIDNDERFFTCLLNSSHGFKRSLPKKAYLQDTAEFLRKVVSSPASMGAKLSVAAKCS
jgi:hypothetical protein